MIKAQSPETHLTHRPCNESPPATRRHRRVALAWAALALLGLLATVAPEQAVAQSEVTLVGNAGQPTGERHTANFQGAVDHAQQFTTGPAAGDTLTKVEFLSKDAEGHTFSAQLCEANNTGEGAVPDPMNCQTLSTTSSFAQDSVVVFTPPGGMTITLAASTRYVVVLSENNNPSAVVDILSTQANNQNGETGWTLADVFDWKQNGTTWMKQGSGRDALIMDVKGYTLLPPAAVSDVVVVPVRRTTDSLTVSWTAPDNAGKPAITGYDVRYLEEDKNNWTTVRQDAPSTSVIITGLRPNGYYDVQVRAVNADGSGLWSSTAEGVASPRSKTVLANHPLIPGDLGPDDSFRLLFITEETTDATDTGIQHYHDLVSTRVIGLINPGGLVSDWGPISLWQTALVSLPGHDARLLTDTTWTGTDRGVPIYWLNGARVADDYADFYDGAWADEANPTNGIGGPHSLADPAPWTGTDHDGTELFDGAASRAIGQATVGVGAPGSTANNAGPLNGAAAFASTEVRPLYAFWHVMVIDENLRLIDNTNVRSNRDEDSDTRAAARAQLFTTGPHSSGYGIANIRVTNGSEDDEFLGAVALHTTDTNGKPDLVDGLHATLSLERTASDTWYLVAPAGMVLKPTTTYALVFQGDAGTYPELWTIGPDRENVAAEGWSLADALLYHDGTSWVENPDGRSLQMEIIGPRMETESPALVSATVGTAGNAVTLAFDEDVALPSDSADALTFLASLASAFDLRADGESVAVSGLTASGTDGLTFGLFDVIVQGQAVTLTYTDPTAGDDAVALQDGLGNESPTFTTGVDGVPDVINNSTIDVPSAPRNLVAAASGTTQINLSWSVPASNGGFAIIGYRIEVSPNGNSNWTELVVNTGNPNTTFADTVAAGTTRHYRVLAINTRGPSIPSGVANDTTNEEKTSSVVVPPPPTSSPTEGEVTEEEVEDGCAVSDVTDYQSLEIFVECAAERIEDSDTFTETLRILEEFRDDEGDWNDGSTYLVLLTARGGVYFHANDREVEDLDWSGILLCEEGEESVLDTQEGCFIEYEGARMGYAHPFSASHVPLARGEEEFVLLGDFDKIPEEGKPFTGMIGEPSTEAGEVDTDDQLKKFVGEAGRVLRETLEDEDSGIDPAELRGILRREGPWREGDVYLYIMSEMGRVIFDGAKRDREQKNEYGKQYVRDLIMEAMEAGEEIVEYREDDFLIRGYTARVEVLLDEEGEDSRVYFVGSGYRVEGQPGGSGCAVGGSGKGGAFGLFLAALTLLLAVLLKRRLADGKAR